MGKKIFILSTILICICSSTFCDVIITPIKPKYRSIRFPDDLHGWLTGYGRVFYTTDGGETWERQFMPIDSSKPESSNKTPLGFVGSILWADQYSAMVRSESGIITFNANLGYGYENFLAKDILSRLGYTLFTDRVSGWGVGPMGKVFLTKDKGETWNVLQTPQHDVLHNLFAVSPENIWVVGNNILQNSTDGGRNWRLCQLPFSHDLLSIKFVNENIGWACGYNGLILKTEDAGKTWQKKETLYSHRTVLNELLFINAHQGFVVGTRWHKNENMDEDTQEGIILYTEDGGDNWKQLITKLGEDFIDIASPPNGQVWVISRQGKLLRTKDNGATWDSITIE
ncbi:MAG: YCF48-related protein [Acidobacteriota bacterium]